ncbi:phosphoglucosamine mutase [Alkalilimnicola ehrlichii]|uniref:phosphoglucosamine mutase n=1 Tax=Alkalilimnicola ehrlichii TaxID=351052 RepID=UPI003BA2949C
MKKEYFGTDGIRGTVGEPPITPDFMLHLGWAAGRVLARAGQSSVLVGKDTRISGYMLESALESGFAAAGVNVKLLGPMPTPAIAYLTRTLRAAAGVVISASHNPHEDNGIKFFSDDGEKLDDATELAIEAELRQPLKPAPSARLGKASRINDAPGRYIEFCKRSFPYELSLRGLRLVVDCANGATYHVAPAVFHELGAEAIPLADDPNGLNINADCGSLHPKGLQAAVREHDADAGIAFDGDGDRVIMVDHRGEVVDGDGLLYIIARQRMANGGLAGPVVGTVMSNLGLEQGIGRLGLPFLRAKVGDRYVMEMLRREGGILGGESSGHLICLDRTTTGDGIVSALQVLEAMAAQERTLAELADGMDRLPQIMVNVPISRGVPVQDHATVTDAVRDAETRLAGRGRVLLRPSGTEPVLRVMVEGPDQAEVSATAEAIAGAVREAHATLTATR